jgi:hypothetical protein
LRYQGLPKNPFLSVSVGGGKVQIKKIFLLSGFLIGCNSCGLDFFNFIRIQGILHLLKSVKRNNNLQITKVLYDQKQIFD